MFGQQQQPFGTPTTQASAFGGFGQSTFGTPSGGLFGQQQQQQPAQQQQQQPLFGSTTTFGAPTFGQPQQAQAQTPSNPFGQTTTTFGASNPFSAQPQQPAQSGGLYGLSTPFGSTAAQPTTQTTFGQPQQQQQATGLFGSTNTGTLFGQSKPGGFGATTTFGAQPASTSLFGTQQPAQSSSGGLFGSTTSGLFGQQPNANPFASSGQGPVGTTVKFSPLIGTDTAVKNGSQSSVTTKNYCISTMKEYDEKKSLEELRYEDYQAGRKFGTATTPAQSGGLFGTQTAVQPNTGGLFGNTTSAYGQTSAFGQAAAKPTGFGTGTSLFGNTTAPPATTGLFGQTTTPATGGFGANTGTTGLFGQPAQNTTATTGFGTSFGQSTGFGTATQQTTQPLFGGMTTQAAQPSAFGSTSTFGTNTGFGQPSAFGTTAAPSTGLFGSQPAATTTASAFPAFGQSSLFSKPATTTAPAFGGFGTTTTTPASTGFAGFGSLGNTSTGTGGGLFGNTTSAFGTSNTAKPAFGGFGQTTTAPTTASFFGSQPATNTQQTGSVFGQSGTTSGGLFGQQTGSSIFGSNPLQQPTSNQSSSGSVHAQIVELVRSGVSDTDVLCNMYSQLPVKEAQQKVQPLSRDTINAFISNAKRNYAPAGGESRKDERLYSFYVAPTHSFDGLNLSSTSGPVSWRSAAAKRDEKLKLDRAYIEKVESEVTNARSDVASRVSTSSVPQIQSSVYSTASKAKAVSRSERATAHPEKVTPPVHVSRNLREAFDEDSPQNTDNRQDSFLGHGRQSIKNNGRDRDIQIVDDDDSDRENIPVGCIAVVLTKAGYYTIPDVYELVLDEKGQCVVDGFLVGRLGCGSVKFLGSTNVAGMNLDKLVTINDKEVVVYPDDGDKPLVGKGLNKKAVVTFENVWPMSSDMDAVVSKQDIIDSGFEDVLRARVTAMGDADFLQYNVDSGQLSFSVYHFSRYKLVLTEEDTRSLMGKRKMPLERSFGNVIDGNVRTDQPDWMKQSASTRDDYISPGKRRRSEKNDLVNPKENNFTPKPRMSYANVSQDVEDYFERAMLDETDIDEPSKSPAELMLPQHIKRYRIISTEFGTGFKPFCSQIFSHSSGEQCVVVDGEGELSIIQHVNCEKEDLTSGSKWLLEEMMEFYLTNCTYKLENSHTRIYAPVPDGDFVSRFCELACKLTEGRDEFVQEKLAWDLFSRLYKSFQSAEASNCEGFYEWLMSAMSLLTTRLALDRVSEESAVREVFLQMICGETENAMLIAREFGLYSIENAIILFLDTQEEQFGDDEDETGSPKDAVRILLRDQVQEMMNNPDGLVDDDQICVIKLLTFLSGVTKMNAKGDAGQGRMISMCEDLNWLQCFAVCAFNLRMSGRAPTDIMDIVQHYEDMASEDLSCILPSDDSSVPFYLFSMIQHYGRLSTHNMKTTLESDITTSTTLDIRVKWFMMRMYRTLHEGFSESSELILTNEFASTLQTCGFPHIAITALMHLPQTRNCTNRIKELSLALSTMKDTNSEVYKLLTRFLSEDVNLSKSIMKETEANLALKNGDYLEAMEQYYLAGSFSLCRQLIRTRVLPVIASGDSRMCGEALGRVKMVSGKVKEMAPYGMFFELLTVIEDIQDSVFLPEHVAERLTDLLEYVQDNREALLVGFDANSVVAEMVKDKLKEGKALLYYGTNELTAPNFSP